MGQGLCEWAQERHRVHTERQIQVAQERFDAYSRRVADLLLLAKKLRVDDPKHAAVIGELLALRPFLAAASRDLEYLLSLDRTPIIDMARA